MSRRNDWVQLRNRAAQQAEILAFACSGERLPTALRAIARARSVKDIQFRPLLGDGSLSVDRDGFVITLSCWPELIENFTERLKKDDTGRFLPRRTRFSLAHEIAHTFFFDLKSSPPRSKYDLSVPQTLGALERACNRVAGSLLLPSRMLEVELDDERILEPRKLLGITRRAAVARATLVSQLENAKTAYQPRGFVGSGRFEDSDPVVEALWRHYSFHSLFVNVRQGGSLAAFFDKKDAYRRLWPFGGPTNAINFWVGMRSGLFELWTIVIEDQFDREVTKRPRREESFLFTLFPL